MRTLLATRPLLARMLARLILTLNDLKDNVLAMRACTRGYE